MSLTTANISPPSPEVATGHAHCHTGAWQVENGLVEERVHAQGCVFTSG